MKNTKKKLETKKKKKAKHGDEWEIEPGADYPVHEKYTQEEPVKE
ncbi:MAG: hypothetical protein AB1668_03660 [Nanoarchaeota archaeon]